MLADGRPACILPTAQERLNADTIRRKLISRKLGQGGTWVPLPDVAWDAYYSITTFLDVLPGSAVASTTSSMGVLRMAP